VQTGYQNALLSVIAIATLYLIQPRKRPGNYHSKIWRRRILALAGRCLATPAAVSPRKAQVVELRFSGGLSVDETAEVLSVSSITVLRERKTAKVWLYRELTRGVNGSPTLAPGR
jgi:hypothetical protein